MKAISLHLFFTLEQSGLIVIGFFWGGIVKYNSTHEKGPSDLS